VANDGVAPIPVITFEKRSNRQFHAAQDSKNMQPSDVPRPEYPRPHWRRDAGSWRSLNGVWQFKISPLPNAKSDVNNTGSFVSSDFVGQNYAYPEGDWATRRRIWLAHEDYQRGLHYFMRTDPRIADDIREEVGRWGLAKDEFADTGHWPFQLYVREARRMIGEVVMTQNHCLGNQPIEDFVGLGSYSLDSHLCRRFAWNGRVYNEGGFLFRNPARIYPISYRALLPKRSECSNLAGLFCFSASHAAFSTLRMEPVLMILGESLAHATYLAAKDDCSYHEVPLSPLQDRLRDAGQLLDREEILAMK